MSSKAEKGNARNTARAANQRRRAGKRRGRRTLHHLLVIAFVLAAGAVLSLTVFFKIDSVVVTGTDRYLPEDIAEASGIQHEDNLLRIPVKEIREKLLEAYPYIEEVEVHRRIPATVEIEVTQSKPAGALAAEEDEYLLITREGKVLERGLLMIPEDVPLIKGVPAGDTLPGEYLGVWEPEPKPEKETPMQMEARAMRDQQSRELAAQQTSALNMLIRLFQAMEETDFTNITNVDLTNPVNMKIMYENRMQLELGSEAELAYKLTFIRVALDKLHPNAHGTLDATNAGKKQVSYKPAPDYDNWGYHVDSPREEQAEAVEADVLPEESGQEEKPEE